MSRIGALFSDAPYCSSPTEGFQQDSQACDPDLAEQQEASANEQMTLPSSAVASGCPSRRDSVSFGPEPQTHQYQQQLPPQEVPDQSEAAAAEDSSAAAIGEEDAMTAEVTSATPTQVTFVNEGQNIGAGTILDQTAAPESLLSCPEEVLIPTGSTGAAGATPSEDQILVDMSAAANATTFEPDLTTIEEQPELGYQSDSSDVSFDLSDQSPASGGPHASRMQLQVQYRSLKNLMPTVSEEDQDGAEEHEDEEANVDKGKADA